MDDNNFSDIHLNSLALTPRAYLRVAVPVVLALAAMGALALYSIHGLGHGSVYGLVPMFLLDAEANIPTFFSALNLVLCGSLLLAVALFAKQAGRPFVSTWVLLGVGALFVAVDEAAQIHELLDSNPQWTGGRLVDENSPWVLAYGVLVLALVVATLRLFLHLPRRYQVLFAVGAAMFVGGSIGLEVVGASELVTDGKTLTYAVINATEEVIELSAVTLVNAALLSYVAYMHGPLIISTRRELAHRR